MIDSLQAMFPINRIVALLTPFLVAASAYIATWVAKHMAFLHLDQGQLAAVFIAGAAAGLAIIYKWIDGWQKHEAQAADPALLVEPLPTKVAKAKKSGS